MRGPRTIWLVTALGVALLAVAVSAHALEGLGGPLAASESHYVQVVESDSSGVLAGMVTETEEGPLGLTEQQVPTRSGWVIVHPEDVDPTGHAKVTEDIPFEDPNGGAWDESRVEIANATAWVVSVDQVRYDATLEGDYNFAVVVDWDHVPEDQDLEVTYEPSLELVDE